MWLIKPLFQLSKNTEVDKADLEISINEPLSIRGVN
jgi:hypothetical protein